MHRLSLSTLIIAISAITPLAAPAQEAALRDWPEYQVIMRHQNQSPNPWNIRECTL